MTGCPNIEAIAAGTISGAFREWPRLREEAKALLRTLEDERKYRLQNAEYAAELEAEVEHLKREFRRIEEVVAAMLAGERTYAQVLKVLHGAPRGGGE